MTAQSLPPYVDILFGISLVLAIAGGLGVSYAVFRSSSKTNTIDLFAKENDALTKALTRQESENLRLQTKVDALANANAVLQETVSGTLAVKELAKEIAREEAQRREEHAAALVLLKDIIAELRQARGAIGR